MVRAYERFYHTISFKLLIHISLLVTHEALNVILLILITAKSNSVQHDSFFKAWIVSAIVSTCYTFTWDIKMDWGLLDKKAGENKFLREEIVYSSKVRLHSQIVFCDFLESNSLNDDYLYICIFSGAINCVDLTTGRGRHITTGGRAE